MPIGDEKRCSASRVGFESTWNIGIPDAVVQLPKPVAIQATGVMPYQNIAIATNFDEDKWLRALEIQPTDRAVVHHVLVFYPGSTKPEATRKTRAKRPNERRCLFRLLRTR